MNTDNSRVNQLIAEEKIVTLSQVDPNNTYVEIGTFNKDNRKFRGDKAYTPFLLLLSAFSGGPPVVLPVDNKKFVRVDSTFGNDLTAQVYNEFLPFQSINAAIAAAVAGDLIVVDPSPFTYFVGGDPFLGGAKPLNFYIMGGADVNFVGFPSAISLITGSANITIAGEGTVTFSSEVIITGTYTGRFTLSCANINILSVFRILGVANPEVVITCNKLSMGFVGFFYIHNDDSWFVQTEPSRFFVTANTVQSSIVLFVIYPGTWEINLKIKTYSSNIFIGTKDIWCYGSVGIVINYMVTVGTNFVVGELITSTNGDSYNVNAVLSPTSINVVTGGIYAVVGDILTGGTSGTVATITSVVYPTYPVVSNINIDKAVGNTTFPILGGYTSSFFQFAFGTKINQTYITGDYTHIGIGGPVQLPALIEMAGTSQHTVFFDGTAHIINGAMLSDFNSGKDCIVEIRGKVFVDNSAVGFQEYLFSTYFISQARVKIYADTVANNPNNHILQIGSYNPSSVPNAQVDVINCEFVNTDASGISPSVIAKGFSGNIGNAPWGKLRLDDMKIVTLGAISIEGAFPGELVENYISYANVATLNMTNTLATAPTIIDAGITSINT
jgi:hypothetical protein